MANENALDTALSALITAEATRDAVVTQALNDLIAKANSGENIDIPAELAKIATLQANAAAITQAATAADPGPTTIPTQPIALDGSTDTSTGAAAASGN